MNKADLRRIFREKRKSLSSEEYDLRNDKLFKRVFTETDFSLFRTIHTFLPLKRNKEPDTWLLIQHLHTHFPGVKVVVPRIRKESYDMECLVLNNKATMSENRYGISEPTGDCITDPSAVDLIFVPLLTFDKRGYRVGYGKGYYDRFLMKCNPGLVKAGLSLEEPVELITDTDGYDVPLNMAFTPESSYLFTTK